MKREIIQGLAVLALLSAGSCSDNDEATRNKEYTITIDDRIANGSVEATLQGEPATKAFNDEEVVLIARPDEGYHFVRWRSEGIVLPNALYNPATFYMPDGDITISADFALTDYTIEFRSLGGESWFLAEVEGVRADHATMGAEVVVTAEPGVNYVFSNWVAEGVTIADPTQNPLTFTMPAGDVTLMAQFAPKDLQAGATFISGIRWAFLNVDAPGTFAETPEAPGMFYQWNRRTGWSTTDPLTSSDGSLWDGTEEMSDTWAEQNDPCPEGWRLPTADELSTLLDPYYTTEVLVQDGDTTIGKIYIDQVTKEFIYLPAAGYRESMEGALYDSQSGYYTSSSASEMGVQQVLNYGPGYSFIEVYFPRANAASVRCVGDSDDGGIIIIPPGDGGIGISGK